MQENVATVEGNKVSYAFTKQSVTSVQTLREAHRKNNIFFLKPFQAKIKGKSLQKLLVDKPFSSTTLRNAFTYPFVFSIYPTRTIITLQPENICLLCVQTCSNVGAPTLKLKLYLRFT